MSMRYEGLLSAPREDFMREEGLHVASSAFSINRRVHEIEHQSERASQGHYKGSGEGWSSYGGSGEGSSSESLLEVLLYPLMSPGGGDGDYGE